MVKKAGYLVFAMGLFWHTLSAGAVEPVRTISAYVLPYYIAARSESDKPDIAVAKEYDHLLASGKREDIVAVRDMILQKPEYVTPMTLMVLAIRLYDAGLRDDSVFWFYVAKDRYITLSEVLDLRSPVLAQVGQATLDFAALAGPTINGYAFCDIKNQIRIRENARQWIVQNPYQAIFLPKYPAKPGDRAINLRLAVEKLREEAEREREFLEKPEYVAKLMEERKKNDAEAKYCWK